MPLYDYQCPSCGLAEDVWAAMDEQEKLCSCGNWSRRVISATRSNPDWQPYVEDSMGHEPVVVKSRQHRAQLMSERGLTDKWGTGQPQRWV